MVDCCDAIAIISPSTKFFSEELFAKPPYYGMASMETEPATINPFGGDEVWASVLVGVFWRGEELATSRVVVRETKTPPEGFPRSRYKFMTWRWFCAGCFSAQL